jgi:hypothetical protein
MPATLQSSYYRAVALTDPDHWLDELGASFTTAV